MKYSQVFSHTQKEAPRDEVSKNAELLIRAGFIYKEMAGVYTYLPFGYTVLHRIIQIIREEMNAIGGLEMQLTALQEPELWKKTDRWSDENIDIWFKSALKNGSELGLGWSQEEPLTNIMTHYIHSYKDLPQYPYQFQTKFRNELRSKSGLMRCREFIMKDLYSFSESTSQHEEFYEKAKQAYINVFDRVGLGDRTFVTFASGGSFSKFSHEFQTITDAGEDTVYLDREKRIAINKEVYQDDVIQDLGLSKDTLEEVKAIEVGNIFSLGTKFSDALGLTFLDENGESQPVIMGCYGIGPGRVMGAVVEVLSDERGIVWPESIAPFKVYLIALGGESEKKAAESIYQDLQKNNIEVLWDDREETAGKKFADADLLGIPVRLVVSVKTGSQIEYKLRTEENTELLGFDEVIKKLRS